MAGNGKRFRAANELADRNTFYTIDDALSLEKREGGRRRLGVHIADVSHFVKRDSALDREAAERGNSVYLPDRVIPMLPEQLSNSVCSLQPNVDRLAFSVFLTFDKNGSVEKTEFARTRIRSNVRLTYRQAIGVLESRDRATGKGKKPSVP